MIEPIMSGLILVLMGGFVVAFGLKVAEKGMKVTIATIGTCFSLLGIHIIAPFVRFLI